jgi:hypothetical protein
MVSDRMLNAACRISVIADHDCAARSRRGANVIVLLVVLSLAAFPGVASAYVTLTPAANNLVDNDTIQGLVRKTSPLDVVGGDGASIEDMYSHLQTAAARPTVADPAPASRSLVVSWRDWRRRRQSSRIPPRRSLGSVSVSRPSRSAGRSALGSTRNGCTSTCPRSRRISISFRLYRWPRATGSPLPE